MFTAKGKGEYYIFRKHKNVEKIIEILKNDNKIITEECNKKNKIHNGEQNNNRRM
jgi:hypothetical protein